MPGFFRLRTAWFAAILLLVCALGAHLTDWSGGAPQWFYRTVTLSQPAHTEGHEYVAQTSDPTLSIHEQPSPAKLFQRTPRAHSPLSHLEPWLGSTRLYYYFSHLVAIRYPDWKATDIKEVGPANTFHVLVRRDGAGRFSVWHGKLHFSTPDNSSPLLNARQYELRLPVVPAWVPRTLSIIAWAAALLLCVVLVPVIAGFLARRSVGVRQFICSIPITFGCVVAILALGEAYLWATIPFDKPNLQAEWHADTGFLYKPGTTAQWTNHLDFWAQDKVNSLGFVDREPAIPKPPGTFRIVLLGDSMVEAIQVPIKQKVQVLLPPELEKRFPGRKFDVVALGYSGTGQSNQLQWLEKWVPFLKPDLVIPMFTGNDFRDNSSLLTSVATGMSPRHPWRLFFRRSPDGAFLRLDPDPGWRTNHLPILADTPPKQAYIERLAILREDEELARLLNGWNFPNDLDFDSIFYAQQLPPVFEEAVAVTAHSFELIKRMSEAKGFGLAVVAVAGVTGWNALGTKDGPRGFSGEGQMNKLKAVLDPLGLPLIDLYPAFRSYGDIDDSYWKHDSHWTPTGHRWVAKAIADYLAQHPAMLKEAARPD